ncbi:MAG: hypothetical protein ABSG65_04750 [Bryobacteraceae bacterium]|jgi:LPS sulfotransferase NodH
MASDSPIRFAIFAAPRTGSNLLCSLLNSHPRILCHHGLFNPAGIHYALDHRSGDIDCGSMAERDLDPEGFLARVWRQSAGKQAIGFKLNRGENEVAASAILRDPTVRKILLDRRNRVKTYVSERIAAETGAWECYGTNLPPGPKVRVEPEALREHIAGNQQYYAQIERELRASGQPFLRIFYESLAPGAGDQERVLAFLGCSPATLIPRSAKRSPDNLRESISKFDELAGALRGTEVEQELYRLDSPRFPAESRAWVGVH